MDLRHRDTILDRGLHAKFEPQGDDRDAQRFVDFAVVFFHKTIHLGERENGQANLSVCGFITKGDSISTKRFNLWIARSFSVAEVRSPVRGY